jgi:2-polyprenyl-6-methoxyphenol hydroxylase-like FAD-dependent oxidoreductase
VGKRGDAMTDPVIATQCCIAGGGPAGMMLGLLLARAGVDTVVLEKHGDFLRDFRGDTIHPSTLEVMHELGLLDGLLQLPHQKATTISGSAGGLTVPVADFSHLKTRCRYIVFMPQWDFLSFLATEAQLYPHFRLLMRTEAETLIEDGGRVVGARAIGPDGPLEIRADLVVGADGRHSTVRDRAGFTVDALGAPMDVLWFALSRKPSDPEDTMGVFGNGRIFVMINRGTQWQCGYVIAKGTLAEIEAKGLRAFRQSVATLAPIVADRAGELDDWDKIKLLTVGVDRLRRWHRPGVLCIGDAAHTMSPVGGVGINLAIQDAVATANLLAAPLREKRLTEDDLAAVQRRRELPTRLTQRAQVFIQNRVISRVLGGPGGTSPPLAIRLLARFPMLRRIPARLVGIGVRPEHVRTPAATLRRTS